MEEIKQTIEEFLGLLEDEMSSVEENETQLRLLCDKLVYQIQISIFAIDDAEYITPPERSYNKIETVVYEKFPNLGNYNIAEFVSYEVGKIGISVENAIEDISEIAKQLYEIRWRFHNTSSNDALWHLSNSYKTGLERNFRNLQYYLFYRSIKE